MRHVALLVLVAVCSTGVHADDRTPRQYLNGTGAGLDLPFSDAVLVGDTLYISGSGGFFPGTTQVPEDQAEEARLLMESFKATLAQADMTMADLVAVTVYCPDLSLYQTFNSVYRQYFAEDYPSRSLIGSGPLLFGMRFEMKGVAVKRL